MENTHLIKKPFPVIEKQLSIKGNLFRAFEQGKGSAVLFCHGFPDVAEIAPGRLTKKSNSPKANS